ncbi:helix-turn-helix transcriptional regulator [Methylomonas koyamae]|nr:helix-turn-helix transcriptional regulator [Methylomonas koyamae]WNB76780.1 helix-turn-helix transcriptional regulator [Methylomonas koyamae]
MEDTNKFAVNQRIHDLRLMLNLSRDEFAMKLGIKSGQLANIEQNKQKAPAWYIEVISNKWPEYVYWVATGLTIPEHGHVSPRLEETRQKLG